MTFSSLWGRLFTRKETKVLILGLDNAGKVSSDACLTHPAHTPQSTILYRITMGSVVASAPTVGSNHEIYDYKGVRFGLIDIGGQTALRSSWKQYFAGTTAIILVIDSADSGRMHLAKAELQKIVQDEVSDKPGTECTPRLRTHVVSRASHPTDTPQDLSSALLLVLANKQDLPASSRMTPAQVSEALGLTDLREREWQIMGCSALTGLGLFEGMDWLVGKLESR